MTATLFTNISQLVTPGVGMQRGAVMRDLTVIPDAAMLVSGGVIRWVGPRAEAPGNVPEHDLSGVAVVPGLITDCP